MDGGAWWAAVWGVAEGQTRLSDFTLTFHFHALEKEMATYSSVLAWRIPGTGEPGGLLSMELHRVGHDWSDLAAAWNWYVLSWTERRYLVLFWRQCALEYCTWVLDPVIHSKPSSPLLISLRCHGPSLCFTFLGFEWRTHTSMSWRKA